MSDLLPDSSVEFLLEYGWAMLILITIAFLGFYYSFVFPHENQNNFSTETKALCHNINETLRVCADYELIYQDDSLVGIKECYDSELGYKCDDLLYWRGLNSPPRNEEIR